MAMYVEQSVNALGVGLSDFMILEALLHKGPLTMTELCDAVLIAGTSMTAAADRLEKKQLVEPDPDETNRRVRRIRLTAEGTSLSKRLWTRHLRDLDELMGYLPIVDRMQAHETLKTIGKVAQERLQNGPLDGRNQAKRR
jgi:MarR family 2-MHQ and catechol resistance regulon transcriptional repressor